MVTRRPRARSRCPRLEAVRPLPSEEATPPVTKMCFVCTTTGFKPTSSKAARCTTGASDAPWSCRRPTSRRVRGPLGEPVTQRRVVEHRVDSPRQRRARRRPGPARRPRRRGRAGPRRRCATTGVPAAMASWTTSARASHRLEQREHLGRARASGRGPAAVPRSAPAPPTAAARSTSASAQVLRHRPPTTTHTGSCCTSGPRRQPSRRCVDERPQVLLGRDPRDGQHQRAPGGASTPFSRNSAAASASRVRRHRGYAAPAARGPAETGPGRAGRRRAPWRRAPSTRSLLAPVTSAARRATNRWTAP